VFAYFVAPFGAAIEYTAEVQRLGPSYKAGDRGLEVAAQPQRPLGHLGEGPPCRADFGFRPL